MTAAKKTAAPAAAPPTIDELRRYTPEEVEQLALSPYTASTLRKKAKLRQIHHHRDAAKITFTLDDLRRNAELGATTPFVKAV